MNLKIEFENQILAIFELSSSRIKNLFDRTELIDKAVLCGLCKGVLNKCGHTYVSRSKLKTQ